MVKISKTTHVILLLIPIIISGLGITISGCFFVQPSTHNSSDSSKGRESSLDLRPATAEQTLHYYNDIDQDRSSIVFYESASDYQRLQVQFALAEMSIVTGVRYRHLDPDAGPFNIGLTFVGDSANADYSDTNVPSAPSGAWRDFSCLGPKYLIDDDPSITFESSNPYSNCIAMSGDTHVATPAHSYFDQGSGWMLASDCEFVVDLVYESIPLLAEGVSLSGDINVDDHVDAYCVSLTRGDTYGFTITQTSGTGNLNMRLVSFLAGGTTGYTYVQTSGSTFPKQMQFTEDTSVSGGTSMYLLLVEPVSISDTAQYSIVFHKTFEDDDHENNDGWGVAPILEMGTYMGLVGADADWYMIQIPNGTTVTVNISFTHSECNLNLSLYAFGGSGNIILLNASATINNWEQVSYTNPYPIDYLFLIRVDRQSETGYTNYDMTLSLNDDIYEGYGAYEEENDVQKNAAALPKGVYTGLVCLDDDWYYIFVPQRNILTVNISFQNSRCDLDLSLVSSSSLLLNSSTSTNDWEEVSYVVTTARNCYIKVFRHDGSGSNDYVMTLNYKSIDSPGDGSEETPTGEGSGETPTEDSEPQGGTISGFDVYLLVGVLSLGIFLMIRRKMIRIK